MESNSRKRMGFLNPLRNPISNSREWRARKMLEISLMKPISNGDQWWELIREDDLPSLDQETDPDLLLLLLKYKASEGLRPKYEHYKLRPADVNASTFKSNISRNFYPFPYVSHFKPIKTSPLCHCHSCPLIPPMALETESVSRDKLSLADTEIDWARLDKTRFHIIGAVLFTVQQALIHPTAVVKTRMQVADSRLAHMPGMVVFKDILRNDGIPGVFRGFGTSAIGSLPGRVLALTSLEMSKDMMLKYTQGLNMPETTRIGVANGVAGMFSNLISSLYFVPLEVICQRLIVQGLPGATFYTDPFDVARKVIKAEGFRGLYRGFGLTALTNSPAVALWWGAYGAAQRIIWRSLGYRDDSEKKPSHMEMMAVQATAGMVAGACSSVITTPIDTVKTRLQVTFCLLILNCYILQREIKRDMNFVYLGYMMQLASFY
ncbi:hypothetical protein PVK06_030855 [Gossypium arboreum]|uniref:Solute carrier family 25 member 44 n=1 Tax=Gossypium arboreum TaxID=29729 RepID=A0ABR0NQC5_GOSAR|nr:hypothetical protein PVK06_030855 [Gossypium arboreum]